MLSDLENVINQLPTPFVLCEDFNPHSSLWSNHDTNSHGRLVEKIINDKSLIVLNNGDSTFFHEQSRTFHAVDLVIYSPSIYPLLNFCVANMTFMRPFLYLLCLTTGNFTPIYQPIKYHYDVAD